MHEHDFVGVQRIYTRDVRTLKNICINFCGGGGEAGNLGAPKICGEHVPPGPLSNAPAQSHKTMGVPMLVLHHLNPPHLGYWLPL